MKHVTNDFIVLATVTIMSITDLTLAGSQKQHLVHELSKDILQRFAEDPGKPVLTVRS